MFVNVSPVTGQTFIDCPDSVPKDHFLLVHGDSCFQFLLSRLRTHSVARSDCESRGGTLAMVKSADIQSFLYRELNTTFRSFTGKFWIGLNDIDKEDVFKWEDGSALNFTNWNTGQGPNSGSWSHLVSHNENDCVVLNMEYGGKWSEYPCESSMLLSNPQVAEHPFICQYKLPPRVMSTVPTSPTTEALLTDTSVDTGPGSTDLSEGLKTTVSSLSPAPEITKSST
ncbi:unnamed protein product [Lymnaea stagnalis]|uniref:C-type lectin domain-containing protein n=1 Tax=Lymnaea stagnalis TaxID=6523 RepID=A0AAV2H165_LYMST